MDASRQSMLALVHCPVIFNQTTFIHAVDAIDTTTVDSLQQDAPNRIVHWIEASCAVQWPMQWADGSPVSLLTTPLQSRGQLAGAGLQKSEVAGKTMNGGNRWRLKKSQ